MTQLNLARLASQGRAFSSARPWSSEELVALLALERECGLERTVAAEHIRNGITTPAKYREAKAAGVETRPLEDVQDEAVKAHQAKVAEAITTATKEAAQNAKAEAEAEAKAKAEAEAAKSNKPDGNKK